MPRRTLFTKVKGHTRSSAGYSYAEVMVIITIIGVLAGIGIPIMSNVVGSSRQSAAEKNLKDLNEAVLKFGQSNWELVLAVNSGTSDEVAIFESLQYRNPNENYAAPGSPYLAPTLYAPTSSDTGVYRAIWNGRMYQLAAPGQAGEGLDLLEIQNVGGHSPSFGTNSGYKPVGAP